MKKIADPYIRQSQVARMLNVSDATILRWRRSGVCPPGRAFTRGTIVWRRSEVESWADARRVPQNKAQ